MNEVLEFIKPLNWETVLGMFLICWYFTRETKTELSKIEDDLKNQANDVKEQSKRTDRLYEMFIELVKEKK